MENLNELFQDFPKLFSQNTSKADKKLISASIAKKVAANMEMIKKAAKENHTTTTTKIIYL